MKQFKLAAIVSLITLSLAAPTLSAAQDAAQAPAAAAAQAPKFKVKKLTRAEVDALLARPESLVIVDVRRPDELTAIGGFPAYLNIQAKELKNYLAYIPRERTVITVSNHAARGGAAGDLLVAEGFKVAGTVGVEDYEKEGGTLTHIAPPPPRKDGAAPAKPAN